MVMRMKEKRVRKFGGALKTEIIESLFFERNEITGVARRKNYFEKKAAHGRVKRARLWHCERVNSCLRKKASVFEACA